MKDEAQRMKDNKIHLHPLHHPFHTSQTSCCQQIIMNITSLRLWFTLLLLNLLWGCVENTTGRVCQYDPESGKPNPLGTKAELTIREAGGNTIFTYQPLPNKTVTENITLTTQRQLIFSNTDIDTARIKLIQNKEYYSQLIGEEAEAGFAPVNEVLTCRQ